VIEGELPAGAPEALEELKRARGACPSAEALTGYATLSADDRAHIEVCSRCQLVLLHLEEPAAPSSSSTWKWALPIAAIVVLAVGLTVFNSRSTPPVDSVRGTEIQPIAPAGTVLGPPILRWQSPLSGVRYRVTVRRGSTVIWSETVDGTEAPVPASIGLEPGAEYTWQVEALDKEGEVRMTSPPQTFVIS